MRRLFACLALSAGWLCAAESKPGSLASPDGRLTVDFFLKAGAPGYTIHREGRLVLRESRLGLVRDDADFSKGLTLHTESPAEPVEDRYEILTAKRRINTYRANRKVLHLQTATGQPMDIIFQVSNDGVAFRYFFPGPKSGMRKLTAEATSFHFPNNTRAWLQPMSVAKTGWERVNPCYEEYYEKDIPAGTPSPSPAGWVYPALFQAGDTWLLVSEGSLPRNYCGTRLRAESPDGEYSIGFPDPRENFQGGAVNPESTLPWLTPWRIIAIGSLKTIAESTLGTDLAGPPASPASPAIQPGKASWSWPLMGDRNTTYDVQKKFIDYAAGMGWRYCLIDGHWDRQIGYDRVKELIDYARDRQVGVLLWYNSAGDWCGAPQTPRDLMLTHGSRVKEFDRLKAMGVAGLKVDFFGGDGQSVINYYHDILTDAAPYGFLMNFHGATLPRGWQRTYPHLMTMEAIKGLEFVTFEQKNADEEPAHATVLPFTRNVFDPMDFTPMVLDRINRITRRTTSVFELALSVLFTSGIQHYAEIPEGMAGAPDYVREFIRGVPGVWDDTRFIAGHPGKFVVLARRGQDHWYLAGINGEAVAKTLTLDLGELSGLGATGTLITDGGKGNLSFRQETVAFATGKKLDVTLPPHGGFVLVGPVQNAPEKLTEVWSPLPPVVAAPAGSVPSDAIVLFDGTNLDAWEPARPDGQPWKIVDGVMEIVPTKAPAPPCDQQTKRAFGDVQLHLEFRSPASIEGSGQGRANTGVFFMGLYEIQILDSWGNPIYVNGQNASIYKEHAPLVNASRPPGEWQVYEAVFIAPRFTTDGRLLSPARITVFHNGVLVQHDVVLTGPTPNGPTYKLPHLPPYFAHAAKLPLMLQDHRNATAFRNIWVRELILPETK